MIELTVTNEKIKVKSPYTGADSSPLTYAALALVTSGGAMAFLLVLRRKQLKIKKRNNSL